MNTRKINPASLYDGAAFGMSQAVVDHDSGLIFISGQVDWNTEYQVVNTDIAAQADNALKNLATVLAEAKASIANIIQLRIYVRGELAEHLEALVPVLHQHLGDTRPAITGIGVASLASPDTLIEIEAVAKLPR